MFQNVSPVEIPLGNQKIIGVMHTPLTNQPVPCVLFVHGFASNRSGRFRLNYELSSRLADQGIASLRIDLRGCGDSEGAFEEMTISSQIEDVENALNWLKQKPEVDGDRIAILGRSLGAAVAVKGAFRSGGIRSLVLWNPFFNSMQWKNNPVDHKGPIEIDGNRPGLSFIKELAAFSLEEELGALSCPILHVHAAKDQVLSSAHRTGYVKVRKKYQQRDKEVIMDESDHFFSNQEERVKMLQLSFDWLVERMLVEGTL